MAINDDVAVAGEAAAREWAIKRLKKRRDFYAHVFVYVMINGTFVAIWAMTNLHGFFWPIIPIMAWGIGLVFNAWDAYHSDTFSETQIQREIERLRRR
jgi:hypothetical protein